MNFNIKTMGIGLFILFMVYLFIHKGNFCWSNCDEKNHNIYR